MLEPRKVWLPIMLKTLRKRWNLTTKAFSEVTKIPVYLIRLIEIHNKPINEKYWPILDKLLACPRYYKEMNDAEDAIIIRKTRQSYFIRWNPKEVDRGLVPSLVYSRAHKIIPGVIIEVLWKQGIAEIPANENTLKIVKELRKLKRIKVIYRED